MHRYIYHITTKSQIDSLDNAGWYVPQDYSRDGFIHCSHKSQIVPVLERFFRDKQNLVLLEIDTTKVEGRIVEENLEGGSESFPHILGNCHYKR